MNYWMSRYELKQRAENHTSEMASKYGREIDNAVNSSRIINDNNIDEPLFWPSWIRHPKIDNFDTELWQTDSVSAIFKLPLEADVAVLNFADYKNPGGRFIDGSSAQEESLCHASFLYNVLSRRMDYYDWNNLHKNKGLYLNRALYSQGIKFFKDGKEKNVDVITCAAPNRSVIKYGKITEQENDEALKSRIEFVVKIINKYAPRLDAVVLGAFGCGVFKQDAARVAQLFNHAGLPTDVKVVYAIPDRANLEKFRQGLEG